MIADIDVGCVDSSGTYSVKREVAAMIFILPDQPVNYMKSI
jgi:hypothetical protein